MVQVALGLVELHLGEVDSLKGKRHVLRGMKEKVKHRFNVSIAEVDHGDLWQRATLAVACVANDARLANEVVSKAVNYIESLSDGGHRRPRRGALTGPTCLRELDLVETPVAVGAGARAGRMSRLKI